MLRTVDATIFFIIINKIFLFLLDLCHVKNIPVLGDVSKVFAMNWRFLPMLDPQVSHMVSRDLDSLINEREAAAVQEWLASDKGK